MWIYIAHFSQTRDQVTEKEGGQKVCVCVCGGVHYTSTYINNVDLYSAFLNCRTDLIRKKVKICIQNK